MRRCILARSYLFSSVASTMTAGAPLRDPPKERHLETFLVPIRTQFRNDPRVDAEKVARAVLKVLAASCRGNSG